MKRILEILGKLAIGYAVTFLIMYLLGSVVAGTFNICEWHVLIRMATAFTSATFGLANSAFLIVEF